MGVCACGKTVQIFKPLDQVRAAGIRLRTNTITTVGDEPLIVDLIPPANQNVNKHWIFEHLCFTGRFTSRKPTNGTPVNGLFLCPPGTPPAETLALATTGDGIVLSARPFTLPVSERGIPSEQLPSGVWVCNITLQPGFKATCPGNGQWFIRAIINCQPAQPTPGPGAGSTGTLNATIVDEAD